MGKAIENKLLKERKLYEASYDLFLQKGVDRTTIDEIVERAGVAKGTFYLYFKDKQDLMDKLTHRHANRVFTEAIHQLYKVKHKCSGHEYIHLIIDFIVDAFARDKKLMRFINKNLSYGIFRSIRVSYPDSTVEHNIIEVFLKVLGEFDIKLKNPEITMYMVVELVAGTCYNSIVFNEPLPLKDYKPYLHEAIETLMKHG
ncbi:MAG: TetR family transcriptional regulator [Bacillales bacterium]|jgi:AcrR family transcriptional regulator|nr:TetR family transcriptional regulator [Bacillales bacterium]